MVITVFMQHLVDFSKGAAKLTAEIPARDPGFRTLAFKVVRGSQRRATISYVCMIASEEGGSFESDPSK
jgi:hypothetical protein